MRSPLFDIARAPLGRTLSTAAICLLCIACSSPATGTPDTSANKVLTISGRTFAVTSIGGRAMPTTVGLLGRAGDCAQHPVAALTLAFRTDGTVLETFSAQGGNFVYGTSYQEVLVGRIVVISSSDTATLSDGTLRVRQGGILCSHEEYVATA